MARGRGTPALQRNAELEAAIAEDPYDEERWIVLEDWLLEREDRGRDRRYSHHMRAFVIGVLSLAACGGAKGAAVEPRAEPVLDALARAIDPGPQASLWPRLPEAVRSRVEAAVPRTDAPAARLAAARAQFAEVTFKFSTTDPAGFTAQVEHGLAGIYLVEDLASADDTTAVTLEARAISWRFYGAFTLTRPLIDGYGTTWSSRGDAQLEDAMTAATVLLSAGTKLGDRYAASVLRARTPESTVDDILWQYAARRVEDGDAAGARPLYAELVRRTQASTAPDQLRRVAQVQILLDDPAAAAGAIARARAALPPGDRMGIAAVRDLERGHAALVKLLAIPHDETIESALARFDALIDLGRAKAAATLLAELMTRDPKDARLRARNVQLRVGTGDVSAELFQALGDPDLTHTDGAYWSVWIGAVGMAIANRGVESTLADLEHGVRELAPYDASRAAVVTFILEAIRRAIAQGDSDDALAAGMRSNFDGAVALRAKYPRDPDADRLVLMLALFTPDPAVGFRTAAIRPSTPPDADAALYRQRARVLVSLAAHLGKAADLGAVWVAIEDIPPTTDAEDEATREALFGDVEILRALAQGERKAWPRAVKRYEMARRASRDVARLDNNLAYAADLAGNAARAAELYQQSASAISERRWVPLLNQATAPQRSRDDRRAKVRAIADELPKPVGLVSAWRAILEDEPAAATAAQAALADFDRGLAVHQLALHQLGLVTDGTFELSVGLRGRRLGHELSASSYSTLWVTRPLPITQAELAAKARRAPPAAPTGLRGKP